MSFSLDDLYGKLLELFERAVQALVVSEPGAVTGDLFVSEELGHGFALHLAGLLVIWPLKARGSALQAQLGLPHRTTSRRLPGSAKPASARRARIASCELRSVAFGPVIASFPSLMLAEDAPLGLRNETYVMSKSTQRRSRRLAAEARRMERLRRERPGALCWFPL